MKQNKRRFWKGLLIAFAILLVVGVAEHLRRKWRLQSYKAELVKQGMIFDLAKLTPAPVPDEENAATLLNMVMAQLSPTPLTDIRVVTPIKILLPQRPLMDWNKPIAIKEGVFVDWEQLQEVLERNQQALNELRKAARRPHLDFKLDYAQTYQLSLNHLGGLRRAGDWLITSSLLHLRNSQVAAAISDLNAVLALTRMLRDEPLVISQHCAYWTERWAMAMTWEILQTKGLHDADLVELQYLWLEQDVELKLANAIMMEQWMALRSIHDARKSKQAHDDYFDQLHPGIRKPFSNTLFDSLSLQALASDIEWLIRDTAQIVTEAAKWFWWQYYGSYEEERLICELAAFNLKMAKPLDEAMVDYIARRRSQDLIMEVGDRPFLDMFATHTLPDTRRAITHISIRHLTGVAIALKRYQFKYGEWPETLNSLVPELLAIVPVDPADGKPLRYQRKENDHFLLYVLGDRYPDSQMEATNHTSITEKSTHSPGKDWVWPMPVQKIGQEQTAAP